MSEARDQAARLGARIDRTQDGTPSLAALARAARPVMAGLVADVDRLTAERDRVLKAIFDLHVAKPPSTCRACDTHWPCHTLRAVEAALSQEPVGGDRE